MRRSALFGTMFFPAVLLLGGCSGLGKFFSDTITLPGMNPNLPFGVSENADRARGQRPDTSPILPESGNVWPGPPQPLPTLNEVSHEQSSDLSGKMQNLGGPLRHGGGQSFNDGGSMSMGESESITKGAMSGADSFSGSGSLHDTVPDASSKFQVKTTHEKDGSIVIPNGDGTNTVIGADGTVKTVKAAPK